MSERDGGRPPALVQHIDWILLGVLLAGSPFFLFPKLAYAWAYLLVGTLVLARGVAKRRFLERSALDLPIGVVCAMVLVSALVTVDLSGGLGKIAGVLFGVLLYYSLLAAMTSELTIRLGVYALIAAAVAFALVGVVDSDLYPELWFTRDLMAAMRVPTYHWNLPGAESGISANALAGSLLLATPLSFFALAGGDRLLSLRPSGRSRPYPRHLGQQC